MNIRGALLGGLLIAGGLACNDTSLKQPGDNGSGGTTVSSGGGRGVAGSGGTASTVGSTGLGGTATTGGATGYGGLVATGGTTGAGGLTGSGGLSNTGGNAAVGGSTVTGGKSGSDAGPDAAVDAFREAFRNDALNDALAIDRGDTAIIDRGDTAIINPIDASAADTRGTDAQSPGVQEYVKTYLEPYCARLSECCAQVGIPYSGLAACEAYELGFVKYLNDGSSVVVPSVIQTLLDQMKKSCDHPSYALIGATTDGTRLSGQPCDAVDQCAGTPALCLSTGSTMSGTCMTPPRGKAGDGCAVTCDDTTVCKWGTSGGKSPNAVCYDQDGLRCDSTTNTCVAITPAGKACTDFSECGAHADCTDGTCQPYAQVGQYCGGSQRCDRNLQCGGTGTKPACQTLSMAWSGSCSP